MDRISPKFDSYPAGVGIECCGVLLSYVYCGFPQSCQANDMTVPITKPLPLPSTSSPRCYLPLTQLFVAIYDSV